jgi:hypothetical protein
VKYNNTSWYFITVLIKKKKIYYQELKCNFFKNCQNLKMQVARIIKKMPSDLECHLSQVN